jgi:hypothetical protein
MTITTSPLVEQSFDELISSLHHTPEQPNPEYWHIILANSKLILLEVALRTQGEVAADLGIKLPKFNGLIPILREFATAVSEADSSASKTSTSASKTEHNVKED